MSIQFLDQTVDLNTEFEAVIGLEVHVQLSTESKIFSPARSRMPEGVSVSEEPPNQNTTEICAGHPGTLPSLNRKAVEFAIRAGLATDCRINLKNVFSRKHYFYADLPKGYQISQFDLPICEKGHLDIEMGEGGDVTRRIGITRMHLEEDAGKSVHGTGFSLINLNRAGTPLIEVVSEPDIRTPEEAGAYLRKLYSIVTCLGICDGNLQEGNFRCDANVSIRPKGSTRFGVRTETKNVNSFRFVEKAIEYEIERQRQVILSGDRVIQETRLYDSQKNQTFSMRSKEQAEDYRYFPDPDLPPLLLDESWVGEIRSRLPELPDQKRDRYVKDFGLKKPEAGLLASNTEISAFFEQSLPQELGSKLGRTLANLLNGEVIRLLNEEGISISASRFVPEQFTELARMIGDQSLSISAAKQVIGILFKEGGSVSSIVDREGLRQVSDTSALDLVIDQIIAHHPKQVEEFRSGKEKIIGFLVGQAMKATQGKANPGMLQEMILKKLKS